MKWSFTQWQNKAKIANILIKNLLFVVLIDSSASLPIQSNAASMAPNRNQDCKWWWTHRHISAHSDARMAHNSANNCRVHRMTAVIWACRQLELVLIQKEQQKAKQHKQMGVQLRHTKTNKNEGEGESQLMWVLLKVLQVPLIWLCHRQEHRLNFWSLWCSFMHCWTINQLPSAILCVQSQPKQQR